MKTYLKYLLALTLFLPVVLRAQYLNLKTLPQEERDKVLDSLAKETILEWGPDWYEDCRVPTIERRIFPKGITRPDDAGRVEYLVIYPWDKSLNLPLDAFVAKVSIWEDNAKAHKVIFGSSIGLGGLDAIPATRSGEKTEKVTFPRRKP